MELFGPPVRWIGREARNRVRILLGAMVFVVVLAAGQAAVPASAQEPEVPADVVDFGRQVAALVEGRDYEALVDLFLTHKDECPLATPGGLLEICEGVDEGESVHGYITAQMGSDAALVDREGMIEGLRWLREEYYGGSGWRLYTVGLEGVPGGYTACSVCQVIIVSSPGVVEASGELLWFHVVRPEGEPLRIQSFTNGSTGVAGSDALIEGGLWDGGTWDDYSTTFIAVEPGAPETGIGLATSGGRAARWVMAAGALLMLASLPLLLGAVRREGRR